MTLLSRMTSPACTQGADKQEQLWRRQGDESVSTANVSEGERAVLLEALYQRLPSRRIAQIAAQDRKQARREVESVVLGVLCSGECGPLGLDEEGWKRTARDIADSVLGLGPIEGLLDDETVTEVMVNGYRNVFFEREGRLFRANTAFENDEQVRAVIDRIVAPLGRRIDEQSPIVNARLAQGHRVNAVIPPLAIDGPALTIRKFRERTYTLDDLVERQTLSMPVAQLLAWAVKRRLNIAVSGGTGGGKTTLLNALSDQIALNERIVTIEDSAELKFQRHPHVVRLEARPVNAEGTGEVTIRDLVVNSLRMRPDRIIVGECRGAETLDMLQAMNTGHDGSMTTLHSNGSVEIVPRLVMMARYGIDLPVEVIEEQIASALQLVVQLDRFPDGSRRVTQVMEVVRGGAAERRSGSGLLATGSSGAVFLRPLAVWERDKGEWTWRSEPRWLGDLVRMELAEAEEVEQWRRQVWPQ